MKAPNIPAAAAQAEAADAARFTEIIRQIAERRHSAAALTLADPDRLAWSWAYDYDVEAEVLFTSRADGEPSTARIPLEAVPRLVHAGATLVSVGAPTRPISWLAVGVHWLSRSAVVVRDQSGAGQLAASRAPFEGGTFGEWFQRWAERSGVPQVNARRRAAIEQLERDYGGGLAERIAVGARTEAILAHAAEALAPEWAILRPDGSVLSSTPTTVAKRLSDRVVDALSVEAFGATRPDLPAAQAWRTRWTEGGPDPEKLDYEGKPRREPSLVYEDDDGEAAGLRPWRAQLVGEWTLRQLSPDPTGITASALADRRIGPSAAAAAGIDAAAVVAAWRAAGLTERQVLCLFLRDADHTLTEIGNLIGRHHGVVSREIEAAQKILG